MTAAWLLYMVVTQVMPQQVVNLTDFVLARSEKP